MDGYVKICTNIIKLMLIDPETNMFLYESFRKKNNEYIQKDNIIENISGF